jgi:hypothetical protein
MILWRNLSCSPLIPKIKGRLLVFLICKYIKHFSFISPSALLSYWDSLGVRNVEEVLEDLGVRDLEENIELKQIDSWINEQIMQGIEVIRYAGILEYLHIELGL